MEMTIHTDIQRGTIGKNDSDRYESMLLRLNSIYAQIPSIDCKHCQACSSPIFWFFPEEINIQRYLKTQNLPYITWSEDEFKNNNMRCPYLRNDRCSIYSVRPLVCRLQGIVEDLPCPNYATPLLSQQQVQYIKEMMTQLLHELNAMNKIFGTRKA